MKEIERNKTGKDIEAISEKGSIINPEKNQYEVLFESGKKFKIKKLFKNAMKYNGENITFVYFEEM